MSEAQEATVERVGTQPAPWSLPDRIALKSTFLGIIRRAHRHVLDDLDDRSASAASDEQVVREWAAAWHIDAPWVHQAALDTLSFWRELPEAHAKRYIKYPLARWGTRTGSSFEYVPWTPDSGDSESEYNDKLVRAFRAHLHQEALRTQADRRAQGFVGPDDRPSHVAHLSWLALWQLEGLTATAIKKVWQSEHHTTFSANAIHKAITEVANELGVERRPGQRGRPRRTAKV